MFVVAVVLFLFFVLVSYFAFCPLFSASNRATYDGKSQVINHHVLFNFLQLVNVPSVIIVRLEVLVRFLALLALLHHPSDSFNAQTALKDISVRATALYQR